MRRLFRFLIVSALIVGGVTALAVIVLIVLNGRDPYGGPIEPSAPH